MCIMINKLQKGSMKVLPSIILVCKNNPTRDYELKYQSMSHTTVSQLARRMHDHWKVIDNPR